MAAVGKWKMEVYFYEKFIVKRGEIFNSPRVLGRSNGGEK